MNSGEIQRCGTSRLSQANTANIAEWMLTEGPMNSGTILHHLTIWRPAIDVQIVRAMSTQVIASEGSIYHTLRRDVNRSLMATSSGVIMG